MINTPTEDPDAIEATAYAAYDAGQLGDAARTFARLAELDPGHDHFHYMQGLAHKYRREWPECLAANLRAAALAPDNEAALWNAAIAATAIGDWATARDCWRRAGVDLDPGNEPIDESCGIACVRLNAWSSGETLYAQRIGPARAMLLNVPLPESGYRYGDLVLNDGAETGWRELDGRQVPVLNVLQRLQRSTFGTYAVFVDAPEPEDIAALQDITLPGLGYIEDWTRTVRRLCLRCSYGVPHRRKPQGPEHGLAANDADGAWQSERNLGIAARSRRVVDRVLARWAAAGNGRTVDAVEVVRTEPGAAPDGVKWWTSRHRDDDDDDDGDDDDDTGASAEADGKSGRRG